MGTTDGEEQDGLDGRVLMVQERLLEALLLTSAATGKVAAPVREHSSSSPSLLHEPTGDEDRKRSAPILMDVDVEGGGDSGGMRGAEGGVAVGSDSTTGKSDVPTAIQVVASMVDSALQVRKVLKHLSHRTAPTTQTRRWLHWLATSSPSETFSRSTSQRCYRIILLFRPNGGSMQYTYLDGSEYVLAWSTNTTRFHLLGAAVGTLDLNTAKHKIISQPAK